MSLDPTENAKSLLEGPERLLGSRVLDFQLMAVLGAGGMAVVYRGVHRVTSQEVAVKILPPELAIHDELKARFVEEARLLALLEHPNIVTLNNFTETGGRLCLVMQFVEGTTFEHQLQKAKPLPWEEVVRVGIEVCKALEHAHKQSVIHRDIKPSNVLVRSDGVVKVTDFGIAKMVGQSNLTSTGQTMGTVRYMSPEQVRGKPLDARSDLYSLGVTMFEGLTGKTPFDADNQFAIMEQHLHKKPPTVASFGVTVPSAVEKVLARTLEKKVEDRFADATALREALESVSRGGQPALPKARRKKSNAGAIAVSVVGLCVLGASIGVIASHFTSKPEGLQKPVVVPKPVDVAWPESHALDGVKLATDERMPEADLRLQAVRKLAPAEVLSVTHRYQAIVAELRAFLAKDPVGKGAGDVKSLPLNLVLVPDYVLSEARLWPGFKVEAGHSYGSRYVEPRRTLFVADGSATKVDAIDRELPYGVAIHMLTPIDALSNQVVFDLAEKFAAEHLKNAPSK